VGQLQETFDEVVETDWIAIWRKINREGIECDNCNTWQCVLPSPFKCNHCGKQGHKAVHCLECLAGKPKAKKNSSSNPKKKGGKSGNSAGNKKPKKDISEIECFNCGKKGHYMNKCPSPCKETTAHVEVALMVKCVDLEEESNVTPKCGGCTMARNHCVET
jgi:Zinc knuckle